MIAEKMKGLVANNSAIRTMFEEGKLLAAQFGEENVFDFSLGNPSVPAPPEVNQAIIDVVNQEDPTFIHGYMSNAGYDDVRQAVAESLNRRFGTHFSSRNIIMTAGAGMAINILLCALLNPGDEVIAFAPYFMEYNTYVGNYYGKVVAVKPDTSTFMPDLDAFAAAITPKTRAVMVNSPNNPSGVVYPESTLRDIARILTEKSAMCAQPIVLIADEPYRELVYGGVEVPYVTHFYPHTAVCYSYSKSLSLPGERVGYLVVPDEFHDFANVITAATIANRVSGCVNAPSLMQRVIKRCLDLKCDVAAYERNRDLLYEGLRGLGFECIKPEGAFYLFIKSPDPDDLGFIAACKKRRILIVNGTAFACPGYARIAYCVPYERIQRALPAFQEVAQEYGLGQR
ncbi:MAG: pyridoxal phosphate-dependent aminotransferase [Lachnospiraceae bacterium]|jgi:aspartate aminotransferase|nr:pyridoxal phosphate-dependent aminotransferase [Lachnospiraceae bacterium]